MLKRSLFNSENDAVSLNEQSEDRSFGDVKGNLTEKDRLLAGKQVLLGLSILFTLTMIAYLFRPIEGQILLEIEKTVFPPLATLIIAFYFKDKGA